MSASEMIGLGGIAVAFVSVVVGPAVSLRIAKNQIRVQVLSGNRQAWIDALRDDLALLLASLYTIGAESQGRSADSDRRWDAVYKAEMLFRRIELRLNFDEEEHRHLAERMAAAMYCVCSEANDPAELARLNDEIRSTAQRILKSEWERVKALS